MRVRIRPTAGTLIAKLRLEPHPGGGHYRETWRADTDGDHRPSGSAAIHLLESGQRLAWHRVGSVEVWLFHDGGPLELVIAADEVARPVRHVLGPKVVEGEEPQVVVPAGAWRSARSLGTWSLAGRVASPASEVDGLEFAPAGWEPHESERD